VGENGFGCGDANSLMEWKLVVMMGRCRGLSFTSGERSVRDRRVDSKGVKE